MVLSDSFALPKRYPTLIDTPETFYFVSAMVSEIFKFWYESFFPDITVKSLQQVVHDGWQVSM